MLLIFRSLGYEEKENNLGYNVKNIYWDYKIDKSDITWEYDDTVIINGHRINLPNGKYDWRKDKN